MHDDGKIQSKKARIISSDETHQDLGIVEESASSIIASVDSKDDEGVKPTCPSAVNHNVSTLSAVSTFGGVGLITTGGMGMTLNKPVDNNLENMPMSLSGGALLIGAWIGNVVYANHRAA